jgi:hypothetical protein
MRKFMLVILVAGFSIAASPQKKTDSSSVAEAETAGRLPVKRVVLYKNGVGYFEHSTRVHGNQDLAIDFTTGQLNDVLKSLTAVDLGEGRISSVRYNSIAPLEERLKGLRLPFGEQVTRAEFLAALRGSMVEVKSGTTSATGRLLSVEKEKRVNEKGEPYDVTELSMITDAGEMRNFDLGTNTSVRLAERDLNEEVGKYLNLIASSRARDLRRMTLSATGSGEREIFVSYISEVPVWKSTYRIILPSKPDGKPLLQGWAIVDNTVGEDWKDVQLSLVAGAPQSFIQQISQPYYVRRPVVPLPTSVMLTPQEHEGTVSEGRGAGIAGGIAGGVFSSPQPLVPGNAGLQGTVTDPSGAVVAGARVTARNRATGAIQSTVTDARGVYQFYGLQTGNYSVSIDAPGFRTTQISRHVGGNRDKLDARLQLGSVSESIEVTAGASEVETENAEVSSVSDVVAKQHTEAESKDLGDYFEYNIKQPITIGKNQSALVPILQSNIEAEKVSIWNEDSKEIRRALWITNSSGLTLDSGTFNILDGETFGGEGLLETVHPAERRLISYAADPALRITMDEESDPEPISRIRIVKGTMYIVREQRDSRKYTLHNSDTMPRQVVIEHPAREGWKLGEGVKPEETSASYLRFRVAVGPNATETMNLEELHPEETESELTNLDDNTVALITKQREISPAMQEAFRRVLDQKNKVSSIENQIAARQQELAAITNDQSRLRENMKALKGTAEEKALLQRYTRELDAQEDRLAALKREIVDLQGKQSKAEEELDQIVQAIGLDDKF